MTGSDRRHYAKVLGHESVEKVSDIKTELNGLQSHYPVHPNRGRSEFDGGTRERVEGLAKETGLLSRICG